MQQLPLEIQENILLNLSLLDLINLPYVIRENCGGSFWREKLRREHLLVPSREYCFANWVMYYEKAKEAKEKALLDLSLAEEEKIVLEVKLNKELLEPRRVALRYYRLSKKFRVRINIVLYRNIYKYIFQYGDKHEVLQKDVFILTHEEIYSLLSYLYLYNLLFV
jgi:hypothetical protein